MTIDGLTIYAIQRRVKGQRVLDFDDVIDAGRLRCVKHIRDIQSPQDNNSPWTARMYLWKGNARQPPWVKFLEDGFGGGALDVSSSAQHCAVVVVKVFFRAERFYAVPFGTNGRFQIRSDIIERRYGLRVALNLLYEGDSATNELTVAPRIRQVESKTVGANTMRTIRQANRRTDFEEFELNPDTDQLAGITGQPLNADLARRIRGTDSLRVGRRTSFNQLGDLCRSIARAHERNDFQRRFRFVGQFQGISDPGKIASLTNGLCQSLQADPSAWIFSIPGIVDFDQLSAVRVTISSGTIEQFVDPTIYDVISAVGMDDLVKDLSKIRVETINSDGNVTEGRSMFDCLDGQIVDNGNTFLIEAGTFYQIEPDYLDKLNKDIDAFDDSSVALPPSRRELHKEQLTEIDEGTYNARASEPEHHLLLDKKTVVIPGRTSPVEVCDILTQDRQLVHVKRKFSSSTLSHLFDQGVVSAELLVDNDVFRARVRERIGNDNPSFQNLFPEGRITTTEWEVVYAIIGPWNHEPPSAKLPFFSKVNLRDAKRRLRVMGFKVTLARVPVIDAGSTPAPDSGRAEACEEMSDTH